MNSIYLMMTNRCNMNCSYCYEREFFKNDFRDMTEEMAYKVVDFLIKNHIPFTKAKPDEDINIFFFGGEPTLNWDVLKKTILYCRKREQEANLKFGLYTLTNGLALPKDETDFLTTIKEQRVKIQFSLDGCKSAHDSTRGHFDAIVKNIKKIINYLNIHPIIRMTVTPSNIKYTYESFRVMSSLSCTITMIPIIDEVWTDEYIEIAKDQFKKIMNYYQKMSRNKSINFNLARNCVNKEFRHCQAGANMVCVTVDGTIYPCHRFQFHDNAQEKWKMGHIDTGIERYPNFNNIFAKCFGCENSICYPCPSSFIKQNEGKAPEYYCKWCKEVEKIIETQALEVEAFTAKIVWEKTNKLLFEILDDIRKKI